MKTALYVLAFATLLFSCKEDESKPLEEAPPTSDLAITRAIITSEHAVEAKGIEFYVALRYWKSYKEIDEVSLSINGQLGTLVKKSPNTDDVSGDNVLFKFSGINQTGDFKAKLLITKDDGKFEQEQTIRFVENYEINTLWNAFDKPYLSNLSGHVMIYKSIDYNIIGFSKTTPDPGTTYHLGIYRTNFSDPLGKQYKDRSLINGIDGSYIANFSNNILQEIRINNGEPLADPSFQKQSFFSNLNIIYGNPTITNTGFDIRTYNITGYKIFVYDTPNSVYTIIRKN